MNDNLKLVNATPQSSSATAVSYSKLYPVSFIIVDRCSLSPLTVSFIQPPSVLLLHTYRGFRKREMLGALAAPSSGP